MDTQSLLDTYAPVLKRYSIPLVLATLGLICLVYGLFSFNKPKDDSKDIMVNAASDQQATVKKDISQTPQAAMTLDIEGAVLKPGVYTLPANARVQDALIASGGLSEKADRGAIAKNLNLAAKLTDGAKLYLPFTGEQVLSSAGQNILGAAASGTVNVNHASADDLDALPGIGRTTAQKIIDNRPYQSLDDLLQKKIVGQKVFGQIKDKISVN